MEQQNELRLTKAEKRIIAELRQLKYGEMRIVMRNGVPFTLTAVLTGYVLCWLFYAGLGV